MQPAHYQGLTSILNDPRGESIIPSLLSIFDVPDEPPALIVFPKVSRDSFRSYLRTMGDLLDIFQRSHPSAQWDGSGAPLALCTTGSEQASSELTTIPAVFFSPNFRLEDPSTFAAICDNGVGVVMQERLGHYLDVVEQELVRLIQARAAAFFAALAMLRDLFDEISAALAATADLRKQMALLDETLVAEALRIAQLRRQRQNVASTISTLTLLRTVRTAQPSVQLLLSSADFNGALALLRSAQKVLRADLLRVVAARNLPAQLSEVASYVERMMKSEFVNIATARQGLCDLSAGADPSVLSEDNRQALISITVGLLSSGALGEALEAYKAAALRDIKAVVKAVLVNDLPSLALDDSTPPHPPQHPAQLSDRVKALDPPSFLAVLLRIFASLERVLKRARDVFEAVSAVLQASAEGGGGSARDAAEARNLTVASREVVGALCEAAQSRCGRIIAVRGGGSLKATPHLFAQLFSAAASFIQTTEGICGAQLASLRGAIAAHAREYLDDVQRGVLSKLTNLLNNEQWKPVDVPAEIQALVAAIVGDPPPPPDTPRSAERLAVRGEVYFVTASLLELVKCLHNYLLISNLVPALAGDIALRLTEALKSFNKQTCQLVLGAGAIRVAGLKSITARTLSISALVVSVILEIHPPLVAALRAAVSARQAALVGELDKVSRDLIDHRAEIFKKIADIIADRVDVHTASLGSMSWEDDDPSVSPYMRGLIKEVSSMHRVLTSILPPPHLIEVATPIPPLVSQRLRAAFSKVAFASPVAKRRLYGDVAAVCAALRAYDDDPRGGEDWTAWLRTNVGPIPGGRV